MNILFYFRMKELKTIYHLKLQIETGLKAKSERADFLSHLLHILTSSIWRRTWDEFWIQGQIAIKSYLWNDRVLKKTTTQLSPKPVATQSMKYWWGSRGVHFFGFIFIAFLGDLGKWSLLVNLKFLWGSSLTGFTVSAVPVCNAQSKTFQ